MDTLKYCLIVIVFSCFCSKMSNASSTPAPSATPSQVEYGDTCGSMTQCNTNNSICNGSGFCACDDTHYYDADHDICTQKVVYGANCDNITQCNTSNSVCNGSGICACADSHYYDTASDTCTQKVEYGADCDNITQCNTTNAVCNGSGICACDDTHYYDAASDTCVQKKAFGDACTKTSECDTSDSNIKCIQTATDRKCLCRDGWYRPDATSCAETSPLKPVITSTPTIGAGNINISWTNTDVTGGYTYGYTVMWSPGSAATTQKSYNIQSLSPATTYTVTVEHIIVQYGRSQTIVSEARIFTTTKQVFGGLCTDRTKCYTSDQNIECVQSTEKRCLCKNGTYKSQTTSSCTETSVLKPVITSTPAIGTGNINISWTHPDVTGGYTSSYTVTWTPGSAGSPASVTANQKSYNIQPLSNKTTYTVTVGLIITLYGRSQTITSEQGTFTTKQVFGGVCSNQPECDTTDSNIQCIPTTESNMKCLCKDGMYKPSSSVPCENTTVLKPDIRATPTIGTGNIDISWTSTDVTGGYTSSYTVTWSPGSPGSAATAQKSYNIQSLSPGTTYTLTVEHTITLYGRSQTITSDQRTFTTKQVFGGVCSNQPVCDTTDPNIQCIPTTESNMKCLCKDGTYKPAAATLCQDTNPLKPVITDPPSTGKLNIDISWTNTDVTGGYTSIYTVTWSPGSPGSDTTTQKSYTIQPLSPGTAYSITVIHTITQHGRSQTITSDPKTSTTTPASVTGLDMTKTNLTAPNITIVFAKAVGNATMYDVTLRGRGGDTYNQTHEPVNTGQGLISVFFTGVVPAVSYNLTIVTQSGNLQSLPYTTVIRVVSTPAGIVTNLKSFDNTSRSVAVEWSRPLNPNGQIYEYIVDVRTGKPSVCVKRVTINCTECSREMANFTKIETECNAPMTVVINQTDIENTAHVIQHNITGLDPDTAYTIDVVAVNEEGPGTTGRINILTPEEGAGNTTNFKAQSRSSSEITLTWDPPQPRPGVTQYNITVYEKQEDSEGYDSVKFTLFGWGIKTYTIGNLSSYWSYKFDIVAETKIGASAIITIGPEMTMESEPTGVLELKVEDITDVFNQVQVSWKCPKQKDGRNGRIVNANLHYVTNQTSTYNPIRGNKNFTNNGDCMWNEKVDVTTEFMYLFEVRLYNRGFAGSVDSVSKDIVGGAPLKSAVMESVKKGAGRTEETVSLNICPKCLNDRTNGQVNITGMMVCKTGASCGQSRKRRATTSAADYNEIANWNKASANSFNAEYRATKPDWLAGNVGEPTLTFTLGEEDCSGNLPGVFCNGKLPAGVTFIVYAFTCTNHGCTTSQQIEVTTKASFPIAAVVGGLVAAVVVILVVVIVVVIRRRRNTKMKQADPSLIETADDLIQRKRPIRMKDFEKRVEEMHKDSNLLFSEEFEDIGALSPKHACVASETGGNKLRNRYVNILPFDQSRVKLRSTDDDDNEETDYINANYIPGYTSPREYIATQGPMTGTVADFWRMVWEQDVNIIIMLSDLLEKGKPKVDKYWPDNLKEPVQYGDIVVEMINYSPLSKYVIKIFQITLGEESRKVRHYFLPGWQDFGANLTPDDVISFVRDVRMQTKPTDKGPICVHCSAGVGRTGTYVSLDVFKQAIDEENFDKELDVFDFVMKMRENRSYMVQTEKQYIFIHDTIKEIIIRKKREMEEREQNIYQNTGEQMKPEENIYANQAYEPDPEELYMNVNPGQPTTVL